MSTTDSVNFNATRDYWAEHIHLILRGILDHLIRKQNANKISIDIDRLSVYTKQSFVLWLINDVLFRLHSFCFLNIAIVSDFMISEQFE